MNQFIFKEEMFINYFIKYLRAIGGIWTNAIICGKLGSRPKRYFKYT